MKKLNMILFTLFLAGLSATTLLEARGGGGRGGGGRGGRTGGHNYNRNRNSGNRTVNNYGGRGGYGYGGYWGGAGLGLATGAVIGSAAAANSTGGSDTYVENNYITQEDNGEYAPIKRQPTQYDDNRTYRGATYPQHISEEVFNDLAG